VRFMHRSCAPSRVAALSTASPALARSVDGTASPNSFAVFRLSTKSYCRDGFACHAEHDRDSRRCPRVVARPTRINLIPPRGSRNFPAAAPGDNHMRVQERAGPWRTGPASPSLRNPPMRSDTLDFARLTNLADGIFAVAMTFLAYSIQVPPPGLGAEGGSKAQMKSAARGANHAAAMEPPNKSRQSMVGRPRSSEPRSSRGCLWDLFFDSSPSPSSVRRAPPPV
jgi:hypothetical protein